MVTFYRPGRPQLAILAFAAEAGSLVIAEGIETQQLLEGDMNESWVRVG